MTYLDKFYAEKLEPHHFFRVCRHFLRENAVAASASNRDRAVNKPFTRPASRQLCLEVSEPSNTNSKTTDRFAKEKMLLSN